MDKKKLIIIALVVLAAIVALVFGLKSVGSSKTDSDVPAESGEDVVETDVVDNGISFDEEEEGADIVKVEAPDEDFYGAWTATSGMALYLYGNIDITIKEDGTWSGNITEEDMSGTWTREGTDLHVVSDDGDIDFLFAFTESGSLVMQRDTADEGEEADYVNTVLTKK